MGYMVSDRLEVSIFIADVEYPLDLGSGNVLNFLHMAASTKFRLPTCCFSILDTTHAIDKITLQDGTPIRIALKGGSGTTKTYRFRRFNSKRVLTGDAWEYTIDGYLDSPRFWLGTASAGVDGSSNVALSEIAKSCGLYFDGAQTGDQMLWMPGNRKMHEFASEIERAGFVDNNSFMKWGVDLDGTLRYRNVNNLPDKDDPTKLVAYQALPGSYTVVDYAPITKSGFTNASAGYSSTRYVQGMDGDSLSTPEESIDFKADTRAPEFNTKVKEQAARGRISHSPINFGTVHPQYERAIYQNKRYASLFSTGIEFLINDATEIQLFDTVNFATQTERQDEDRMYSGNYIVNGRVLYVKGANYAEKIYASRTGTNLDYNPK